MQLSLQIFAATVGGNQLNAELSGWGFVIGSRQRLLQQLHSVSWLYVTRNYGGFYEEQRSNSVAGLFYSYFVLMKNA